MDNKMLSALLAQQFNVSTEDNAQVEVNFNIDTDEDGAPTEDVLDTATDNDEESALDASESEGEADTAEADMDQLEEAQDSLESLGVVLNKHASQGTMSRMGVGFYQLALESIAGRDMLEQVGVPSLEGHSYSKHHATLLSLESHRELMSHVNTVSMESVMNWLSKVGHKFAVFFQREKALLKRAKALKAVAETSENEKSSNDNLKVNAKKSVSLPTLLTVNWTDEKQFVKLVAEFAEVFNAMASVNGGFDDAFVDNMFPGSNKWPKNAEGKPSKQIFGMKLVRDKLVEGHTAPPVKKETTVVNLTPATCKHVLNQLIELLEKGDMVHDNLITMMRLTNKAKIVDRSVNKSTTVTGVATKERSTANTTSVDEKITYPPGYIEMLRTISLMLSLKMNVITEILNYVNYSLTDREFV